MTVRQRLLGSAAAFLAAAMLVGTVQAQHLDFPQRHPGHGRPLSQDEVKARIEQFLGGKGIPGQPQLPNGMTPERLLQLAKRLGIDVEKNQLQLDDRQKDELRKQIDADPKLRDRFKEMQQKGVPPFNPNPNKGPRPTPPFENDAHLVPPAKADGPGKQPAPPIGRPMPPNRAQPIPNVPQKQGDALRPPLVPQNEPPPLTPPDRERRPWEEPESPQEKARQAAAAMWERNVGPLDETPAVKKALFDLGDVTGDLKDPDGNNLWDTFAKEFGDGKGFGDLLDGFEGDGFKFGDNWDFPKFNWNFDFNWGNNRSPNLDPGGNPPREGWWSRWRRSSSSPSSPSSGSSWFSGWKAPRWNIGIPALDGTWLPVVFLVATLVAGFFLWRYLARRWMPAEARIDPYALGPWPVDPFHLATRQDVVIAFEHLSVLICGPVAKTWTHTTIAGALSELAMAEPERAMMLARLYELARYTPVEEPLTTAELAEARRIVCKLAGFTDD